MDTTEGVKYIRTKETIRGKEQARKIVGCGVCWVAPCTAPLYYLRKLMNLIGWKFA
jgi:hypothetical protein